MYNSSWINTNTKLKSITHKGDLENLDDMMSPIDPNP